MYKKINTYPLIFLFLLLSSCASNFNSRNAYMLDFYQGNLGEAESRLTETLCKKMPSQDFRKCNDSVWLLLDRATTRLAMGDADGAIDDYKLAIDAMDYFSQDSTAEDLGKFILQDDLGAYAGEDYEQVLARVYFALALIQKGDLGNAHALLRQAEEFQQQKREQYLTKRYTRDYTLVDNSLSKYLFAALLEHRGDISNATVLYTQTGSLIGPEIVQSTLPQCKDRSKATVIVLCHNGNSPRKISTTTDASIASTVALECFLSSGYHDPAISCLGGIPTPALVEGPWCEPMPVFASVDGQTKELEPFYDVSETAHFQLEQKMPVIVARGVARYLIRRGAVGCVQNQDPAFGQVLDFAMLIANVCTKADTRTWSTLPSCIDLARYDLDPGCHQMSVMIGNYMNRQYKKDFSLELKSGDLCIINVFNIYPGVTTVQIPQQFRGNP